MYQEEYIEEKDKKKYLKDKKDLQESLLIYPIWVAH